MSKRLPQFSDTYEMEEYNGGDWCAAKQLICFASNKTNGIVIRDLQNGTDRTVTANGKGEGYPRFSPDGSKVLFLSTTPGQGRQVHVCELASGEVKCVTAINGAAMEPIWSPDGTRILFASSQGSTGRKSAGRPDEAVVIEDFHYKVDGAGFIRPDGHVHLFVADLQSGEVTQLTQGQHDYMHHNWSPDGQSIVYCSNENRSRAESIGFDLFVMDVATPEHPAKQISQGVMIVSYPNPIRPVFTPDGSAVVMGILNPNADYAAGYPACHFYRFPVDGSDMTAIFEPSDDCFQCVQFPYNAHCGHGLDKVQVDPDTGDVYFVAGWMGQGVVYRLRPDTMHAEKVLSGKLVCHGLGRIQQGRMLITKSESDLPEAYYLMDIATGALEKVAQSAQDLVDHVKLSRMEDFFFDTLDGESRVHGFVLPPQDLQPGQKAPTILYIHGGPHPFYTYGLTMEFQCFAAAGFGVICCNPRGSSGYGVVHQNMARAKDGSAYMDCLKLVEEAARRFDWIDVDRMGVTGGSYGGYMTNYIATHPNRFKAFVTQRSVASELIMYASSDMQGHSKQYANFEEFMVNELKSSAVAYAERINKPFLILQGEDDYRTPVEGAHQLFVAVKDTHPDLPVKLVIYPYTAHDQPRDPRLLKHYYEEMVNWFKLYL